MNLVFIHGRGQGQRNETEIRMLWLAGLDSGFRRRDIQPVDQASVLVPFYGAELDRLTAELRLDESERVIDSSQEPEPRAVSISDAGPEPADPDPLTGDIVDRIALRAAVTDAEAATEAENVINRTIPVASKLRHRPFHGGCAGLPHK